MNAALYHVYLPMRVACGASSVEPELLWNENAFQRKWDGRPLYVEDVRLCYEAQFNGFETGE